MITLVLITRVIGLPARYKLYMSETVTKSDDGQFPYGDILSSIRQRLIVILYSL